VEAENLANPDADVEAGNLANLDANLANPDADVEAENLANLDANAVDANLYKFL